MEHVGTPSGRFCGKALREISVAGRRLAEGSGNARRAAETRSASIGSRLAYGNSRKIIADCPTTARHTWGAYTTRRNCSQHDADTGGIELVESLGTADVPLKDTLSGRKMAEGLGKRFAMGLGEFKDAGRLGES